MYKAEALYDFVGQYKGDLSFRRGEILNVLSICDESWCKAEKTMNRGEAGTVPVNYISKIDSSAERHETSRALYGFTPRNAIELGFKEGDFLLIIDRDPSRKWWKGELNGKRGIVPSNYIEISTYNPTGGKPVSTSIISSEHSHSTLGKLKATGRRRNLLRTKRHSLILDNMGSPRMPDSSAQRKLTVTEPGFVVDLGISFSGGSNSGDGGNLDCSNSSTELLAEVADLRYISYPFAEPNSEKNSYYKDGVFLGGNIYKVVEYLTSDAKPFEDEERINEMRFFCLTYKMSITPGQLLQCLVKRFEIPKNLGYSEEKIKAIQLNTLILIKNWVNVNTRIHINVLLFLIILIIYIS